MKTLATRVRALREEQNLSRSEAARLCDVPISNWRSIETAGTINPRVDTLAAIAAGLGVSMDYLATGRASDSSKLYASFLRLNPHDKETIFLIIDALAVAERSKK